MMSESLSIFDIFKIGVGPSSSHTLGPWKASLDFVRLLESIDFDRLRITLYGSLSKTGKGHCTDIAIQLGLLEYQPETIDTKCIASYIHKIKEEQKIDVSGRTITFEPSKDIVFNDIDREGHPNTVLFEALKGDEIVLAEKYYSIGGGFIEKPNDASGNDVEKTYPYKIDKATDLLEHVETLGKSIDEIVMLNETHHLTEAEVLQRISDIFYTMKACVFRGVTTEGVLPGGLEVKRRAAKMCRDLLGGASFDSMEELDALIRATPTDFITVNKWVSCFALAVNEENADLGRVVTSPTNGAAGVIPAVCLYYYYFISDQPTMLRRFFLSAGEIGCIFKKGATISAAVGGCQAEIGVSSAMAAAGLTQMMGGTPKQVLMAAEIAMEHHLGLTCDPIGGLVQIPCIERNTMGAMKAITASNLALSSNPDDAKVSLDVVVATMWETAQAMNEKYKETSEGGLAYQLPVIIPEC